MDIPVKFDINDVVYLVHNINSMYYAENKEYIVTGIDIIITATQYNVTYALKCGQDVCQTAEKFVFSSYTEACEFTDNMNKGGV